jgi:hypothetical protein
MKQHILHTRGICSFMRLVTAHAHDTLVNLLALWDYEIARK